MIDITNDIQSLTTFRRRSGDFMKQLKKNKRPRLEQTACLRMAAQTRTLPTFTENVSVSTGWRGNCAAARDTLGR
jgi:hypothetical protein